jgi:hypothetical protein
MEAPEAYHSHPPNPELSEQLISRVGYVEDAFEVRTLHGKGARPGAPRAGRVRRVDFSASCFHQ